MSRPLTKRERAVLDALLSVEFGGVTLLRKAAKDALVIGGCDCGCPSIDFYHEVGAGMEIHVNAQVHGSFDGLFVYTVGGQLGGIEWVGNSEMAIRPNFPIPQPSSLPPHDGAFRLIGSAHI